MRAGQPACSQGNISNPADVVPTMQTFLPYADLKKSAEALQTDVKRLGKQRVETLQLILSISATRTENGKSGLSRGWQFHPASRMWAMDGPNGEKSPYLLGLLKYQEEVCKVWTAKGYKDTCWEKSRACFSDEELERYERGDFEMPPWFGDPEVHKSHRSRLVQKAPEIYGELFDDADLEMDYIWPGPTLDEARAALGLPPSKQPKRKRGVTTQDLNPASAFEREQESDADSEADIIVEDVEAALTAQEPIELAEDILAKARKKVEVPA